MDSFSAHYLAYPSQATNSSVSQDSTANLGTMDMSSISNKSFLQLSFVHIQ